MIDNIMISNNENITLKLVEERHVSGYFLNLNILILGAFAHEPAAPPRGCRVYNFFLVKLAVGLSVRRPLDIILNVLLPFRPL